VSQGSALSLWETKFITAQEILSAKDKAERLGEKKDDNAQPHKMSAFRRTAIKD
jgi:hypothetical protein